MIVVQKFSSKQVKNFMLTYILWRINDSYNVVSFGLCLSFIFLFYYLCIRYQFFVISHLANVIYMLKKVYFFLNFWFYLVNNWARNYIGKLKIYISNINLAVFQYSLFFNATFALAEEKQNWIHAAIAIDGNKRNAVVPILECSLDGIVCNPVFSDPRFATLVVGILQIEFLRRGKALDRMWTNLADDSYQYWRDTYAFWFLDTLLDNTYGYWMLQYVNPQGAMMLFSILTAVGILADPIGDAYNDFADRTEALINRHEWSRKLYTKFQDTFLIIERRDLETYRAYIEDKRYAEMVFGYYNWRVSFKEIDGQYWRCYIPKGNLQHEPYKWYDILTKLGYKIPSQEGPGPGGIWVHLDKDGNLTRPPKIEWLDPKHVLSPQISPAVAIRVFLKATDPDTISKLSEAFNFLAGGG